MISFYLLLQITFKSLRKLLLNLINQSRYSYMLQPSLQSASLISIHISTHLYSQTPNQSGPKGNFPGFRRRPLK